MQWPEVRKTHPDQWLIIEALAAHTDEDWRRLDQIAVVETCPDGAAAFQRYRLLHQQYPARELYFVHAARGSLDIREQHWLGVRRAHAPDPA